MLLPIVEQLDSVLRFASRVLVSSDNVIVIVSEVPSESEIIRVFALRLYVKVSISVPSFRVTVSLSSGLV